MDGATEHFYEALCRTAGFALAAADRNLTIRAWNERAVELFGRPAESMLGTPLPDAFPEEMRPQFGVLIRDALEQAVSNDVEFTLEAPGGDERVLVAIVSPIVMPGEPVSGVSVVIRDITARRAAMRAVRETAARLRAILETAAEGIITADAQGRIESFNPAAERIFGWKAEEIIGRNLNVLMPEPHHSQHDDYIRRYLTTGQPHIIGRGGRELTGVRRNGETFPLDLAISEVQVGSARIFTGIVRDMTERKRLADELATSQRMAALGNMANGVSHHFNNILGGVLTSIDAALMSDNPRTFRRTLERAADAIGRASRITQQLLAFSENEYATGEPLDLNDAMRKFLIGLRSRLAGGGVELVEDIQPVPPLVVESHRLPPILEALCQNSIDAMKSGGRLTIRMSADERDVMISIEDSGEGIKPEHMERIFEPFFTTRAQVSSAAGGNVGLGLSAVHGLVRELGGQIQIASKLGVGTTVTIRLPLRGRADRPAAGAGFE